MSTLVQTYIALTGEYDSQDVAEIAVETSLGYLFDTYVDETLVLAETADGLVIDVLDPDWYGSDMQVVAYTLLEVEEWVEDEQYQSGTEFVDVLTQGTDAEGNEVSFNVPREVPVYLTREVVKTRTNKVRRALSYVR